MTIAVHIHLGSKVCTIAFDGVIEGEYEQKDRADT